jgi:hypothetical protein
VPETDKNAGLNQINSDNPLPVGKNDYAVLFYKGNMLYFLEKYF